MPRKVIQQDRPRPRHVRADLEVIDRDALTVRGERPFVLTNCFTGERLGEVTSRIRQVIGSQRTGCAGSSP